MGYRTFEEFIIDKHANQYVGTDDCMPDDFNDWVQDLGVDEWLEYGEAFFKLKDKSLQHFKDSSGGLWCTDKPEAIPEDKKHLFFQLIDSKRDANA